jgi:predicted DNA-binding ribbon-helix-helix protein
MILNISTAGLVNRNIIVKGKRTSIRLEPTLWDALATIAQEQGKTINQVCSQIADSAPKTCSFTSAVRVYIINNLVAPKQPNTPYRLATAM